MGFFNMIYYMRVTEKFVALHLSSFSLSCSNNYSGTTDTNGNAIILAPLDGYAIWSVNDIENV